MPSTTWLINRLKADFPQFCFLAGDQFRWSPHEATIYYSEDTPDVAALLHELSHAILNHQSYTRDIQLVEYEQAAWQYAKESLAHLYKTEITDSQIEESLDTYRDWLHARSTCPGCQATGLQTKRQAYSCLACQTKWQVNDARICGLRRVVIN